MNSIIFNRKWGMPTPDTFDCKPIGEFVERWMRNKLVSVDPFSRNKTFATHTNDINPETKSQYHMDAFDFLKMLEEKSIVADIVIFDPPFSPRQIKECYDGIGKKMGQMEAFRTHWKPERDIINRILKTNGIILSFGWNSIGMGKKRGYEIKEILMVCHGPGHNDTICMAEEKFENNIFDV